MSQPITEGKRTGGVPIWAWFVVIPCACLLVVPVILAAILFPVFAQAREKARQAVCMSNVKSLSTAVLMYEQDYDQRLPDARQWSDVTAPYYKNSETLMCPSIPKNSQPAYGYAFNRTLSKIDAAKIRNPRAVPMLYDSTSQTKNAADSFTSLPNPGRHSRGNTIGYFDGHVQWQRAANPSGTSGLDSQNR